jgi:hypothetical protein
MKIKGIAFEYLAQFFSPTLPVFPNTEITAIGLSFIYKFQFCSVLVAWDHRRVLIFLIDKSTSYR